MLHSHFDKRDRGLLNCFRPLGAKCGDIRCSTAQLHLSELLYLFFLFFNEDASDKRDGLSTPSPLSDLNLEAFVTHDRYNQRHCYCIEAMFSGQEQETLNM